MSMFACVLRRWVRAFSMRSVEDTSVRWRLTSSIALVILLRLSGCETLHGLESWRAMDLQILDQMHFVFALPSQDVSAQATRFAYWREDSFLWMSLLAAWRTLLERWQMHRPQGFLSLVVLGAWWTFTRRALAGFRCSSVESLMEGVTSSAEDWRRKQMSQTAADGMDIFSAPLSWDALATDEAPMLLANFLRMHSLPAVPQTLPWQEHSYRCSSETTESSDDDAHQPLQDPVSPIVVYETVRSLDVYTPEKPRRARSTEPQATPQRQTLDHKGCLRFSVTVRVPVLPLLGT